MLTRRFAFLLAFTLLATGLLSARADAAKYVVYFHGRSMKSWPPSAKLFSSSTYTHIFSSYDGSSRLTNTTARSDVKTKLSTYCSGTNQCVVVCYSAGCLRYLLAVQDLKAAGTPASGILWTEALASAAGGTELAEVTTSGLVKLLAKLFVTGVPSASAIDNDLTRNATRSVYGYVQNGAPSPVYHVAGGHDLCITIKIMWLFSVKLCGNKHFPGGYGDGAVPVHSSGGYANTLAHANLNDGGAKYTFRAYEQAALFDKDHRGIFEPGVALGSIRLAVSGTVACANAVATAATTEASIVYQDGDGPVYETWSPLQLLMICGNNMFAGSGETALYATCIGQNGCCSNFSNGATSCTCGETLCAQAARSYQSFFTGDACDGVEYTISDGSWDGLGMRGMTATTATTSSMRGSDGICRALTDKTTYNGGCPEYRETSKTYSTATRVYRPTALVAATSVNRWPGYVVSSRNYSAYCP
jgi:hypothetical protein